MSSPVAASSRFAGAAALLVVAGSVGWAAPASAAPTTITTDPAVAAHCSFRNDWTFLIDGVAGSTGIVPPASITAELFDGGTVEIPLTEVIGDDPDHSHTDNGATYTLRSTQRLTGMATAVIDDAWQREWFGFGLHIGPCGSTDLTLDIAAPLVSQGETLTAAGQVTSGDGEPLAGRSVVVHVATGDPDDQPLRFDLLTDPDGRYEVSVPAAAIGWYDFVAEMAESAPGTGFGEFSNESSRVTGWSMPDSVPPADGSLESAAGTTFGGTTVLRGEGFGSESRVAIVLYPERRLLTTTRADYNDGALEAQVTIPSDVEGPHTLVAVGYRSGGNWILTLPVTIQTGAGGGGGELPVTGNPVGTVVGAGVALLGLGGITLLAVRRRRTRFIAG